MTVYPEANGPPAFPAIRARTARRTKAGNAAGPSTTLQGMLDQTGPSALILARGMTITITPVMYTIMTGKGITVVQR